MTISALQNPGIRIWDLPTRLFHAAFALTVIGAIVCAKIGSGWMAWHIRLGIVALALLFFRLVWGVIGPRYARFSQFVVSPARAWRYLRSSSISGAAHAGHNPAGGWSVIAMLIIIGFQAVTGLFSNDDVLTEGPLVRFVSEATSATLTGLHKFNEKPLFAILILHLVAIAAYSLKGQSIVAPMITGDVPAARLSAGTPGARDDARTRLLALLIAAIAATGAWWLLRLS